MQNGDWRLDIHGDGVDGFWAEYTMDSRYGVFI